MNSVRAAYSPAAIALLISASLLILFVAVFSTGVNDSDSITHYLFSKHAFKYPALFLDLWNKPVFTLLSAPFAQFGFTGMKIFNGLCGICSLLLLYKLSFFYSKNFNPLIIVLSIASAFHLVVLNSALTEPLFEMTVLFAVYLLFKEKYSFSAFVFSTLPFIRQEGYIVLLVMLFYFPLIKKYKATTLLFTMLLIVSVAGAFYHGNLLWVFANNPNAHLSHYGQGGWFDYFHKLAYILGKPLYAFVAAGIIAFTYFLLRSRNKFSYLLDKRNLPLYLFFAVLGAHVIFWKFGLFKSLGMERNIITVFGCAVIIAFIGIKCTLQLIGKPVFQKAVISISIFLLIAYPFYPSPKKVDIPSDFQLSEEQKMIAQAVDFTKPVIAKYKLYTGHPYVHLKLGTDPFDSTAISGIYKFYPRRSSNEKCIVLWEKRLSVIEYGVDLNMLEADSALKKTLHLKSEKEEVAVFMTR